ncbi:MAG: hypothetical protein Q4B26_03240, partial [Eubacteriales bacterium]|nr:hypothetical protein [Eubacteriales bacterium]
MSVLAPTLTKDGKRLLVEAIAGNKTITFTKMKVGDGEKIHDDQEIGHEIVSVEFTSLTRNTDYITLTGAFDNNELSEGFYMKEIGVYATDGKNEILFAYTFDETGTDYIPVSDKKVITTELSSVVAIGDAKNVEISFIDSVKDEHIAFDTPEEITDLESGDTVATLFGKIKAWLKGIKRFAFEDLIQNTVTDSVDRAVSAAVAKSLQDQIDTYLVNHEDVISVLCPEIYGKTPYIDFHYGDSSNDYTSRIIERA